MGSLIVDYQKGVNMKCIFYKNTSDNRKLNKNISFVNSVDCEIKEQSSMENPVIILYKNSIEQIAITNYAYLDTFQRFYFIEDMKVGAGGIVEVYMRVDVLQSFAPAIKSIVSIIERNEYLHSDYIQDELLPTRSQRVISYHYVGSLSNENTIVLTVNGGDLE